MALDSRSVVITLKLDSGKDASEEKPTDTKAASQSTDKDASSKSVAVFATSQMIQIVGNEVVNWAEFNWNKELIINDDYIGQREKNIAISQIQRAVGSITTIASMAASGAMVGGPAGAIVGAAVGTVAATANIVRSNLQGLIQQDLALKQMNAQLQFTRSRAGWSVQAASIGEDL